MLKSVDYFDGDLYSKYRPNYPIALYDYLTCLCKEKNLAWDCCTGTGIVASKLAEKFVTVFASDNNQSQLNYAIRKKNIIYKNENISDTKFAKESVDLVTIAQAFHWLDQKLLFDKLEYILKPNGIVAIWCYNHPTDLKLIDIGKKLYDLVEGDFINQEAVKMIESGYSGIETSFSSISIPTNFLIHESWSKEEYMGYLRSLSAAARYKSINNQDPLFCVLDNINQFWETDTQKKDVYWKLALRIFKK